MAVHKNAFWRREKPESHFRLAGRSFTFRKLIHQALEDFLRILANGHEAILNSIELLLDAVQIHVRADRPDLFGVVLPLRRTPPHDRRHALDFLITNQPVGNIDHDVAGTDDRHMFAHLKGAVAEPRQTVEVVHHVFGVEDALR